MSRKINFSKEHGASNFLRRHQFHDLGNGTRSESRGVLHEPRDDSILKSLTPRSLGPGRRVDLVEGLKSDELGSELRLTSRPRW